jgi:signal transduction histidine kinase/CheY-like chemotaxis protein
LLEPYGVRSILAIPIHFQDNFWGFITFDDCHREYAFENRDVDILKSGSLMVASILERNEYAARLESALREAHDANRAKSDFLARMSHEMRTPLNAIIGLSEVALGAGGISNSETHSNFSNIHSAGMTLLATVNDILDISKIAANKIELVPREYGLTDLLHDVTTQGTTFLGEKPVKFVLDVDESLPARLCGDELRVKQIVNNLLSNACKFIEEGMVELSVSALREGDAVWLTCRVRDTGIGIRSQDLGNLFTDYTRLDAAATGKITGTGLGLSITRRLSELMGGGVTVESEYGKGSTFTVRIRQGFVDEETIGPDIAARLQNFSYGTTKRRRDSRFVRCKLPYARVLVVDDVRMNLAVAKGLLKPYEMQIDCVSGGQEAIDAIRGENVRYDAVFMDHMMPGIDGIEATRIIREEIGTEYAQTIPIIALTANALVGNDELFLSKGFQAFLSKPIDALRLDAIVMQWIRDEKREKQVPDGGGDGRG